MNTRSALRISMAACLPLLVTLVACGGDDDAAGGPPKLSETYRRLGDSLGPSLARLKTSATSPVAVTAAELGGVAPVPKDLTGGIDLSAEQKGKTGEKAANIDAVGADEAVVIFVPDAPTSGTAATLPSFAAWKGDADSNDTGLCYLAWTKGASWFVASKCGDTSGAWVCEVSSAQAACNACNTAGECTPCDLEQSSFTCAWP